MFLLLSAQSQSLTEIEQFRSLHPVENSGKKWEAAQKNDTEYEWAFSQLFLLYKRFVSSQDINACSFTPSCSVYALEAIKAQGILVGGINFFDRFARCNSLSPEDYSRHPHTRMLYDPVDWQESLPDPGAYPPQK
jgi:hypothetical protein